jgi:hypothetical protein
MCSTCSALGVVGIYCVQQFGFVTIYQKCDNSGYSNYQVISLLSAAYKILPNIVLYDVTAYVEKNSGNSQCGFLRIDRDGSHIVYWSGCGGRNVRG